MKITKVSSFTGVEHTREINLTDDQFLRIQSKSDNIQNIVPHLSADDREFLITGITPEEWGETFGPID